VSTLWSGRIGCHCEHYVASLFQLVDIGITRGK